MQQKAPQKLRQLSVTFAALICIFLWLHLLTKKSCNRLCQLISRLTQFRLAPVKGKKQPPEKNAEQGERMAARLWRGGKHAGKRKFFKHQKQKVVLEYYHYQKQ